MVKKSTRTTVAPIKSTRGKSKKSTRAVPTESAEQIRFVGRVRHFYPDAIIFAIPNGGGRSAMEATKLKEEGVLAGVPDLFVAEPRGEWHGLFIEMKRVQGGSESEEQEKMRIRLTARGYLSVVCNGTEEAWNIFETYITFDQSA